MEQDIKIRIYKDLIALGKKYSISPEEVVQVLKEMKPKYTREDLKNLSRKW